MERIVTIVLIILIVLVGFFVAKRVADGQSELPQAGERVQCQILGGSCMERAECGGNVLDPSCGEGQVCCAAG